MAERIILISYLPKQSDINNSYHTLLLKHYMTFYNDLKRLWDQVVMCLSNFPGKVTKR